MIKLLKLGEGKFPVIDRLWAGLYIAEQNNVNYLEIGTKRWKCQVLAQTKKETLEGLLFVKNISSSSRLGCWVHSISTHNCWSASQSLNRDKQRVIRCCPKWDPWINIKHFFFFFTWEKPWRWTFFCWINNRGGKSKNDVTTLRERS